MKPTLDNVSAKLHSLYYFLKFPKFRKARDKINAFYMYAPALLLRNGTIEDPIDH